MAPKRKLVVIKVPLGYKQEYKSINFDPMPQLYLDLIENKDKVKPELRDTLFEPRWDDYTRTYLEVSNEEVNKAGSDFKQSLQEFVTDGTELDGLSFSSNKTKDPNAHSKPKSSSSDFTNSIINSGFSKPHSEAIQEKESPHGSYGSGNYVPESLPQRTSKSILKPSKFTKVEEPSHEEYDLNSDPYAKEEEETYNEQPFSPSSHNRLASRISKASSGSPTFQDTPKEASREYYQPSSTSGYKEYNRYQEEPSYEQPQEDQYEPEEQDELANFLSADMQEEKKPTQSVYSSNQSNSFSKKSHKQQQPGFQPPQYSAHHHPQNHPNYVPPQNRPAGLDEINRQAAKRTGVLNLQQTSKADEEKISRRGWLQYKFQQLRKLYPAGKIPDFGDHVDVEVMEREYQALVRQLEVEAKVTDYRNMLIVGFGVVEFLVSKFLHFDEISGFAGEQMIKMNQYDKILYELGEKYQPDKNKKGWPPELQLFKIVAMNAAIFVGMKMLMKGATDSIMSSKFGGNKSASNVNPTVNATFGAAPSAGGIGQPGRKPMRGPDIDLDDLN